MSIVLDEVASDDQLLEKLREAVVRNCECKFKDDGTRETICGGHMILEGSDTEALRKHMLFVKRLATHIQTQEWATTIKDAIRSE